MSNWDFGRPPANSHDAAVPREDEPPYPIGGVQLNGNGIGHPQPPYGSAGGLDDEGAEPYPITYERGRFEPGPARPPAAYEPWPPAPQPGDQFAPEEFPADQFAPDPYVADLYASDTRATGELPRTRADASFDAGFGADRLDDEPWVRAAAPITRPAAEPSRAWTDDQWQGGQRWPSQPRQDDEDEPRRRWMLYGGIAVAAAAIGGAAILLTSGHPGTTAAGSPTAAATPSAPASAKTTAPRKAAAAPLSMAQAQGVLAGYTTVNNAANAQRNDAQLATIETGGSYAIDSGLYLMQKAAGATPYPAFSPASATYYVPGSEPANGPRWFVVRVSNAFLSSPKQVSSQEYLLFTQAAPGGAWQNAIEPYVLSGANVPQPAVGANGLATAVTASATSLATAPGQIPRLTAASLNGTGSVTDPGNLADSSDRRFWQGKLPTATVTDTHALATGAEGETFALRTADGGALVFYTDTASLLITPPAGTMLHLTVPGLYSSAQSLPSARLSYLDQFAAYDPPAGSGAPRIVADYSGITGKA